MARRRLLPLLLVPLALLAPSTAASAAAVDTFVRFEENAQGNWVVTEDCGDGTTSRLFVSVIGGREFESPDLDDVNTFATVRVQGVDCEGNFVNDRASGPATYTGSPSLQEAHLTGTVTSTRTGAVFDVDVTWEGTGGLETSVNSTTFPGFVGVFTSKEREATATGTVVVDGETLVSGPADSADIETLEDRNTRLP